MSVSSIHKFACGCECIEYLDMNGYTLPDMERCKEHYTYWDGQVEVLKKKVRQLRERLAGAEQTFRNLETGRSVRAYGEDDSLIYHNELDNMRAVIEETK